MLSLQGEKRWLLTAHFCIPVHDFQVRHGQRRRISFNDDQQITLTIQLLPSLMVLIYVAEDHEFVAIKAESNSDQLCEC